jgi:hypothetical protein
MGWSKKGSEQIARLRTMRCNSGNIVAYAKEKLTARTHQETPTLWESVFKIDTIESSIYGCFV